MKPLVPLIVHEEILGSETATVGPITSAASGSSNVHSAVRSVGSGPKLIGSADDMAGAAAVGWPPVPGAAGVGLSPKGLVGTGAPCDEQAATISRHDETSTAKLRAGIGTSHYRASRQVASAASATYL